MVNIYNKATCAETLRNSTLNVHIVVVMISTSAITSTGQEAGTDGGSNVVRYSKSKNVRHLNTLSTLV